MHTHTHTHTHTQNDICIILCVRVHKLCVSVYIICVSTVSFYSSFLLKYEFIRRCPLSRVCNKISKWEWRVSIGDDLPLMSGPVMIISGPAPPNKRLPTPPLRSCRPAGATGYLGLSSRFSFLIPSRENLSVISFYITWWDESPTLDDSPHSGFASLTTSPYKTDRFIQFSDSRQKLESACGCLASHPNSEVVNSVGKMSQFLPTFHSYLTTKGQEKDINCCTNTIFPLCNLLRGVGGCN